MFSHLRHYPLTFTSLLLITFGEKLLFALHHGELREGLSPASVAGALLWGLRFDVATAAAFSLLAFGAGYLIFRLLRLPFRRTLEYTTFAAGAVLILLHGADLLYYGEAGRHLGYELKEGYNSGAALALAAIGTYAGSLAEQLLLIALVFFLNRRLFRRRPETPTRRAGLSRLVLPELELVAVLLLSVVLVRGGLQSVPLEPLHAQEIGDPKEATLALNGAYNALFSSITPYSIQPVLNQKPGPEDLARVRALYGSAQPRAVTPAAPLNVVVVLLESWSAEYMSAYGFERPSTPVFEQLRTRGLTTPVMLADGLRTTEGMFSAFCSAQNPLGATVAQTQLQNFDYDCLPERLAERGYESAFFQGTLQNTSGTGAFARLLGFAESYGKEEMPKPQLEPNSWGQHDPDVYRFAHQRMQAMRQPFLIGINTNSTHDSQLPPGAEPAFEEDDRIAGYLNALHFSDASLGDFIRDVESDPAIGPTVFVLLADHTGRKSGDPANSHAIPFVLYAPGRIAPQRVDRIASQRDVAPTLLDLLGMEIPGWFTGKSLLRNSEGPYFADFYHAGRLGWAEEDLLTLFPVRNPDQAQCYTYAPDSIRKKPVPCGREGREKRQNALAFSRVFQDRLFSGQVRQFSELRN